MRRFLVLLLLVMAPVQFSWSAVAAYCLHEVELSRAAHFGHHAHAHEAGPEEAADEATEPGLAGVDRDCGHCQATQPVLPLQPPVAAMPPGLLALPALVPNRPPPASASRPERPQWPGLA